MTSFEKQILNIRDAFAVEYSRASSQLEVFYKSVSSFFDRILGHDDDEEKLHANISKMQDVCFFLKSFCAEADFNMQLLKLKDTSNEDIQYAPLDDLNQMFPFELYSDIFTYTATDVSKYKVGFEVDLFISYVKDKENKLLFLMEACSDIVIKLPEFLYASVPESGVIFGLFLDGCIVRAVRQNCLEERHISIKVLLIDFGEIIEITAAYKFYLLPEKKQQIPGQAFFCKLIMNDDDSYDDEYFVNRLHKKNRFRITKVYRNTLEIMLVPEKTSENTPVLTLPITENPFNDSIKSSKSKINTEVSLQTSSHMQSTELTQEQIDVLYEEPLNTENALEAVMGYTPQDDNRICRFFEPKINGCFKGAKCKLEHTTILKDGWTKDRSVIKLSIHSQMPVPKVGNRVNLLVSYVTNVERFYAQIIHKNCKSIDDLPAEQLYREMNTEDTKSKFVKFTRPPGEFELVFALFKDGCWYRAKVLTIDETRVKVYYVDYGNCSFVTLDEIRKWDDKYDQYPFQALECRLDNVCKKKDNHKDAIAYLENLILQRSFKAIVTCNIPVLHVTLVDQSGFDVGQLLCASEFATPKRITVPPIGQFPG